MITAGSFWLYVARVFRGQANSLYRGLGVSEAVSATMALNSRVSLGELFV